MSFICTSYHDTDKIYLISEHEFFSQEFRNNLMDQIDTCIKKELENTHNFYLKESGLILKDLYEKNEFYPFWTINYYANNSAKEVIELLKNSKEYGLNPDYYGLNRIIDLEQQINKYLLEEQLSEIRSEFEIALSFACINFMHHLRYGLPENEFILSNRLKEFYINFLKSNISNDNLDLKIVAFQPDNFQYTRLHNGLKKYLKRVILSDEEVSFPESEKDTLASYQAAKIVLIRQGFLKKDDSDLMLVYSLKTFQKLHGLKVTGMLNRSTIKQLKVTSDYKYKQIALNLDRLRKEKKWGENYIFVNIPSFILKVINDNKVCLEFNVVVGNPNTPTPVLASKMERIITVPEWSVPRSITVNEILPKVKNDSLYLERNNFKIVDDKYNEISKNDIEWKTANNSNFNYYFVQRSGNGNALGALKFNFPNSYSVYMHDTPSKKYFGYESRAYSHGCIRLEEPVKLAEYLIAEDEKDIDIVDLINKKEKKHIRLNKLLDVYIKYLTCEADADSNIYFYNDIYERDKEQIQKLFN